MTQQLSMNKVAVEDVLNDYIRLRRPARSTSRNYRILYAHHLAYWVEVFPDLSVITPEAVLAAFELESSHKPFAANNAFRLLSSLFRFASRAYTGRRAMENPVDILSACALWNAESPRQGRVTDFPAFRAALQSDLPSNERALMFSLLLSGLRFEELARLRKQDIQYGAMTFTVRLKQGRLHTCPMTALQLSFFTEALGDRGAGNAYVFVNAEGKRFPNPSTFYRKLSCEKLTFHDMRRTWHDIAREAGVSDLDTKLIIGHAAGNDMTLRYSQGNAVALRPQQQKIQKLLLTKMGTVG